MYVFKKNMAYILSYFTLFHYTEFHILCMLCEYQLCFEKYISSSSSSSSSLFWFRDSSKRFLKITKNPNWCFGTNNIRIIVYLNDTSLMWQTLQETMTARVTLISLLQNQEFVINLKKSILQPVNQLEFLELQINTEEMALALSEENFTHIIQQCQEVYSQPRSSVLTG